MRVEAKAARGLGGWEPAEFLEDLPGGKKRVRFLRGGVVRDLPGSQVREREERRSVKKRATSVSTEQQAHHVLLPGRVQGVSHALRGQDGGPRSMEQVGGTGLPAGAAGAAVARGLRAVPKPSPPGRDKEYLRFCRTLPCANCGRTEGIEPHHFGPRGTGQKTDDLNCCPLCHDCHIRQWHGRGSFDGCTRGQSEVIIYRGNRDALRKWIRSKEF